MPGSDPGATLAWLFNPIFQTMFLTLTFFDQILRDIGFAIIALTLVIKTLLIPLFRQQIVSQRRMQMLQPEIGAINAKYKGNRTKISEETMRLYRERNVNPASGCLPTFLQLFLLLPIYSVISQGLSATNITSALQIFGIPVLTGVTCQAPGTLQPCLDPHICVAGRLPANVPEILFALPLPFFPQFGLSALALISASLQLIQTRMMTQRSQDPADREPAANPPVPAADLNFLRRGAAGGPFHLLDRFHGILDSAAIPHRWVGITLPTLRMDPGLCAGPHAALPGGNTSATRNRHR